MTDLMIDLETLGTSSKAVVISLGAVFFDPAKGVLGPSFYQALTVQDQMKAGREVSPDTLKWWFSQSGAAQKVFHEKATPTHEVLNVFGQWFKANGKSASVWGNGSSFDISILEDLYRQYEFAVPWNFTKVMDLRTFKRFVGGNEPIKKSGTAHNALQDAINQANYVLIHAPAAKRAGGLG